jgi:hypothetical protein
MRYKFVGNPGDNVLEQAIAKLVKEAEARK